MRTSSVLRVPTGSAAMPEGSFATVALVAAPNDGRFMSSTFAHIPFDFLVGEKVLAAGPYSVEPCGRAGMVVVRRAEGDPSPILVQAIRVPRNTQPALPKLLFYCQRGRYFLAQILTLTSRRRSQAAAALQGFPRKQPLRLETLHSCPR